VLRIDSGQIVSHHGDVSFLRPLSFAQTGSPAALRRKNKEDQACRIASARPGNVSVWILRKSRLDQIPNLIEVQMKSYQRFLQMDLLPSERDDGGFSPWFTSVFPIRDFSARMPSWSSWTIRSALGMQVWQPQGPTHLRRHLPNCGASVVTNHIRPATSSATSVRHVQQEHATFCNKCVDPRRMQLKYDVNECRKRGMTYSAPLKVTIRLTIYDKDPDTRRSDYPRHQGTRKFSTGGHPAMTENGTSSSTAPSASSSASCTARRVFSSRAPITAPYFSGKIIPYRGSWWNSNTTRRTFFTFENRRQAQIPRLDFPARAWA